MNNSQVRIVATTDFVGSFFAQRTSYGQLPGAGGLIAAVDALRREQPFTLWVDTGDLMQGSALGPLTDGAWGFLAARTLGIDAAAVGNHELDWGLTHLRRWSTELPFPLLAANADLGLPATTVLDAGSVRVGVVGVTYPQMPYLHPGVTVQTDTAAVVRRHAQLLRDSGVDVVVLAIHDGVDLEPGRRAPTIRTERMRRFCEQLDGCVDLVLGGHTLANFHGRLGGIPYLQPWPFGSQVGVADLGSDVSLSTRDVSQPANWDVPGIAVYESLKAHVVGVNPADLASAPGRETSLSQAVADGMLTCDDRVDVAIVGARDLWNQPPRDGTYAYLPQGPVSFADILRLTPCSGRRSAWGGQLLYAEVTPSECDEIVETVSSATYAPDAAHPAGAAAVARRGRRTSRLRLVLPAYQAARVAASMPETGPWATNPTTWRDALLSLPWIDREAGALRPDSDAFQLQQTTAGG